jgi:nitrogen regulatory protein PII
MYLLTAIFSKSCLEDVLSDLREKGIEGFTICSVSGKGGLILNDENTKTDLDDNVKIEIVISNDAFKESAKEVIRSNTRELNKGSGKMWVTPVLEVERIRTGEVNEAALRHSSVTDTTKHPENYYTMIDTPAS